MTDYFALLDQPRQPWLDLGRLKEAFHAKTLREHPDAQRDQTDTGFAAINEAYQVLRDPKRRLEHLLDLQGHTPAKGATAIPKEVEALFPTVATLIRDTDVLVTKQAEASGSLSRSLLKADAIQLQQRLRDAHAMVLPLHSDALVRLQHAKAADSAELRELYLLFSYSARWLSELEEKQLQMAQTFI